MPRCVRLAQAREQHPSPPPLTQAPPSPSPSPTPPLPHGTPKPRRVTHLLHIREHLLQAKRVHCVLGRLHAVRRHALVYERRLRAARRHRTFDSGPWGGQELEPSLHSMHSS